MISGLSNLFDPVLPKPKRTVPALHVYIKAVSGKKKHFNAGVIALCKINSACPINLFDPILLYLLPKLKSGQQPPRPVYVKALYLQQQKKTKELFYLGEIALWLLL